MSILLIISFASLMVRSGYVLNGSNGKLEDEVKKERRSPYFKMGVKANEDQTYKD